MPTPWKLLSQMILILGLCYRTQTFIYHDIFRLSISHYISLHSGNCGLKQFINLTTVAAASIMCFVLLL